MRKHLADKFPGSVVDETVQAGSGKFEVTLDGKTLHSKLGGDGHLDCYPDKLATLVDKIKKAGY